MKIILFIQKLKSLLLFRRNREVSFSILIKVGRWIMPNYRFCWPHMDWWRNDSFNSYLKKFGEDGGYNTHRRWMLSQLMRLIENVPGDTAECGVYEGCGSWAMIKINEKSHHDRRHHIFDSFEGLSIPDNNDGNYWAEGNLSVEEAYVRKKLGHGDYNIYKGWIPERFDEINGRDFSFVHVDVDLYQPTKESIEFFYHRLNDGGIFLCDDYGFDTCPGATKAIDEFLEDKIEKMICLPDGGGFLIKGMPVSRSVF